MVEGASDKEELIVTTAEMIEAGLQELAAIRLGEPDLRGAVVVIYEAMELVRRSSEKSHQPR
jgi:hypothetical protein